ncbi:MAG: D-glycerate dehydrogenase [Chloroflexi bacterium]|nr:D-glycerate dehydrogenase [Chloroflexota bacterium]
MKKPKVFLSWRFPDPGPQLVMEHCETQVWEGQAPIERTQFLSVLADVDGTLVSNATEQLDRKAIDAAPRLRCISNFGVGYDNVDVPYATSRGIAVCNTPGVLTETTADHAFALLLAAARRIPEGIIHVKEDRWRGWNPWLLVGREVNGATLGIVGLGAIGTAVARRARGFGMSVLYWSRAPKPHEESETGAVYSSLQFLLQSSDFICITVALTPETRGLIGAREFALMKPAAILVNVARGPIVDRSALYDALHDGTIFGAALDVTDPEPLRGTDPLLTLPNLLIVPHTGSATDRTRSRMSELAARNLTAALCGERPLHIVNPEVLQI